MSEKTKLLNFREFADLFDEVSDERASRTEDILPDLSVNIANVELGKEIVLSLQNKQLSPLILHTANVINTTQPDLPYEEALVMALAEVVTSLNTPPKPAPEPPLLLSALDSQNALAVEAYYHGMFEEITDPEVLHLLRSPAQRVALMNIASYIAATENVTVNQAVTMAAKQLRMNKEMIKKADLTKFTYFI